ncbi:hypothetical protein AB6809_29820 [Paraburkholderia sp. RCC_158]|uniref:hypothetical protein n=1 Tax=Paraburkholderia sp. RCC_158 TaxID=3239220 RepID=UPI0035258E55
MAALVGDLESPAVAGSAAATPAAAAAPKASEPTVSGLKVFVDVGQLKQDLQVNPNDLDDAVISQAPMFVHYAQQAALARRQWEKSKLAAEVTESQLDSAWRKKFLEDGTKVTEKVVENAVKSDPRYIKAHTQVIEARALYDIANDAREAYMQRKDMIVQISVDRRRERDGQLRILAAKETETAIQSGRDAALAAEAARRAQAA